MHSAGRASSAWTQPGVEQLWASEEEHSAWARLGAGAPPHLLPLPPSQPRPTGPSWALKRWSCLGLSHTTEAGSNREPFGIKRTQTHQFFVHFCFDVSGESEECLWNKHIVKAPWAGSRWELAGSGAPLENGYGGTAGWLLHLSSPISYSHLPRPPPLLSQ